MIKYRDHRGGLDESMATVQEFETREDLLKYISDSWDMFYVKVLDMKIEPYSYDKRIDWDTHIVTVKLPHTGDNYIPVGFTNGTFK